MIKRKKEVFSVVGILGLVGVFLILTMTDAYSTYTSGNGFLFIDEQKNTNAALEPIGIVKSQGIYRSVVVLRKDAKKVDFSEIKCREQVNRDMVQIAVLGRYPLDAGVKNFSINSNLIEDIGYQWGRPVPTGVMNLFKQYASEFKTWVDNPNHSISKLPETVKFGNLTNGTCLFYMPFKNGGSVGPVEYTGVDEKALIIEKDGKIWIMPYKCGNGPAEVLVPCVPTEETYSTSPEKLYIPFDPPNFGTYTNVSNIPPPTTNTPAPTTNTPAPTTNTPTHTPVPEPSTLITLLIGLIIFTGLRRRQ